LFNGFVVLHYNLAFFDNAYPTELASVSFWTHIKWPHITWYHIISYHPITST